jgi:hypothetical protein
VTRLDGLRQIAGWREGACVRLGPIDSVAQARAVVALAAGPLRASRLPPGVVGALVRRRVVVAKGGICELAPSFRAWLGDEEKSIGVSFSC